MWSKEVTVEEVSREQQLLRCDERFFKRLIDDHVSMTRHDNTIESAHNIIRSICNNNPLPLDIQQEAGATSEKGSDANQTKKTNLNQTKKQRLANMGTSFVKQAKKGSGKLITGRGGVAGRLIPQI